MRAFLAVLAVVWTLLLSAIGIQLYQINQHLAWVSAPIRGLHSMATTAINADATKTREQRVEEMVADMKKSQVKADEWTDAINRFYDQKKASSQRRSQR